MRKNSRKRMRTRKYWGTLERNGEKIGLEADTFWIVMRELGGRVDKENLAKLGDLLWFAQKGRTALLPEMPKSSASLEDWFEWQDKMEEAGQVVSLDDIAKYSIRTYETVKKAHSIHRP